jgi:hypothetical protein
MICRLWVGPEKAETYDKLKVDPFGLVDARCVCHLNSRVCGRVAACAASVVSGHAVHSGAFNLVGEPNANVETCRLPVEPIMMLSLAPL